VVSNPAHGVLTGTAPQLIYTPTPGFTGADSFTFKANDGKADSNTATINITVAGNNTKPVADDQNVFTNRDKSKAITLTGSDNDGDALTYTVLTNPVSGTLTVSGTLPHLLYTPKSNLVGAIIDNFTFKVNDGLLDSDIATVKITLVPPGVPAPYSPVANSQNVVTSRNTPREITLVGTDANNDLLTYTVLSNPLHGVLTGAAPKLTYTPNLGFGGSDSFTFKVTNSRQDGNQDSNVATVNILVTGSNTAPVADDQAVTTPQDTAQNILLSASDTDNDALAYTIVSQPSNGVLSGTAPNLAYTPNSNFSGSDSFTFKANDGQLDSNVATVHILVTNTVVPNTPPLANDQTITTAQDTAKSITLTASDADNNPLTYSVVSNPAHGALSGTAPNLTYTPNAGFSGEDSFTFKANDAKADSNVAAIHITVVGSTIEGSITGIVYNDKNLNGQKDAGEPGIAKVTVILNNATDNAVTAASPTQAQAERRTTTDADGAYRFAQVPAGNYTIKIELPVGFEVVGPAEISLTVGATGQTTAPTIAVKGYALFLPLIRNK